MNDLLSIVRGGGAPAPPPRATPPAAPARGAGSSGDVELGLAPGAPPPSDKAMADFFAEVASIKGALASIRDKQAALSALHERSKAVTRGGEMTAIREQMQADVEAVSRAAHSVKARLERLDKANAASAARRGAGPGTSTERSRTAITAALKKRLRDAVGEFAGLRARLGAEYRDAVERRVFTVTGARPSPAQVDAMIESGESETIFQKAILEQGRGAAVDALADVRERHEAVRDLEASLLDLHQVFLDMAVLVEAQGEMLDSIEAQVARAKDHVESGVSHLVEAKRMQKRTRRLMCCALVTLLVIVAVIVLAILKPWQIRGGGQSG